MEVLNWMAEHWLLTIVLAWIVTGGFQSFFTAMLVAVNNR